MRKRRGQKTKNKKAKGTTEQRAKANQKKKKRCENLPPLRTPFFDRTIHKGGKGEEPLQFIPFTSIIS